MKFLVFRLFCIGCLSVCRNSKKYPDGHLKVTQLLLGIKYNQVNQRISMACVPMRLRFQLIGGIGDVLTVILTNGSDSPVRTICA